MNKEELVGILNFLHREHVKLSKFSKNLDGIKIDLNSIDESIISRLYNFIQYKINSS